MPQNQTVHKLGLLGLLLLLGLQLKAQTFSYFQPQTALPSTFVTISGPGFENATEVLFNGAPALFYAQNIDTVVAQVPTGASTGIITVVSGGVSYSSVNAFNVGELPPSDIVVLASHVGWDTPIDIVGNNFSTATHVYFNGIEDTTFVVRSSTRISATVPPRATTGKVKVVSPSGEDTSRNEFIINIPVTPVLASFSPTSGIAGQTVVTISGIGIPTSQVFFNGVWAGHGQYVAPDARSFVVPFGVTTGPIVVRNGHLGPTDTSTIPFVITGRNLGICYRGPNLRDTVINPTALWSTTKITVGTVRLFKIMPTQLYETYSFNTCGSGTQQRIRIYQRGVELSNYPDRTFTCPSIASSTNFLHTVHRLDTIYVLVTNALCNISANDEVFNFRKSGLPPVVTGISRTFGSANTDLHLYGRNLQYTSAVSIGSSYLNPTAVSDTMVTCRIETSTESGRIAYGINNVASEHTNFFFNVCTNARVHLSSASGSFNICQTPITLLGPTGQRWRWSTGDTTQNLTVSTPGRYSVEVNNNGCINRSAQVTVSQRTFIPLSLSLRNDTLMATNMQMTYRWFHNNQELTQHSGHIIPHPMPGIYRAIGSENGCSDTSGITVSRVITNLENTMASASWNLYPNPASQVVNIDAEQPMTLGIYAITGTLVQQAELNQGTNAVPINMLAPGIYYLTDGRVRKRLVVW